jgi:uncharacterized protein YcfL
MKYLFVLLLVGCAGNPPHNPVYKPVEVLVPVKTECSITWPEAPVEYMSEVGKEASVLTKGNAAIAELKQYRLYVKALVSALNECLTTK